LVVTVAVCGCAFVLVQVAPLCQEHRGNDYGDADPHLAERLRREIETDGDKLIDLHVWRLGPGHLGAVMSVRTDHNREAEDYHRRLRHFAMLSHLTVEVHSL
jgi:Co/Zn/Cd efflux system component